MPRPIIRHTPSDAQKRATRNAPHQIRIIGGEWKRTPLHVVDLEGLRPTPDRVRETLFNWLGRDMSGQTCLDLFAGSGALGFEAASRGAARVVMVERDGRAAQQLRATQDKLAARTVEVAQADALRLAAGLRPGTFDVIFLDPPFEGDLLARALALCLPLVNASGALYVEASLPLARLAENEPEDVALRGGTLFPSLSDWQVSREGRAGAVHYHLLRRKNEE